MTTAMFKPWLRNVGVVFIVWSRYKPNVYKLNLTLMDISIMLERKVNSF